MTSRAWFIVPAALVLMVVITVWMVQSQTAPHQMYEGEESADVTLVATSGHGVEAATALTARLRAVGMSAQTLEVTEQKIRLRLMRVSEPREAIAALIDPEPLRFQVIAEDQHAGDAGPGEPGMVVPWLKGTSRADLQEKIRQTPPPRGMVPAIECIRAGDRAGGVLCAAWLTAPPAALGSENVTDVHVGAHERTEEPEVTLKLDAPGARALEALTRMNVGRMIAVVAFGELQARPRIDSPVTGGEWTFSTRTGDTDRRNAILRAERLVAAARAKPLPPLVIESVEPAPAGPVPKR
ncbi:MAG: hypothetical protein IRZ16_01505 [Myxococcaceae bacterium]|nr:hypothetical protein [Myxococcaceae bacterium]